jgi:hypothetical protein
MTFDEVRVIHSGEPSFVEKALRSPAQRHTDLALTTALDQLNDALEAAEDALAWLRSVGAIIPRRLQDIPVGLRQLLTFVEDEQRRRG